MTKLHTSFCRVLRETVCVCILCGKKPFLVHNVKINIVFNVILFWLIQDCKVCCQERHLEQGVLCDYGESCKSCQVLQLPSPSAYCYEALLCCFQRKCLQLVLQHCLLRYIGSDLSVFLHFFCIVLAIWSGNWDLNSINLITKEQNVGLSENLYMFLLKPKIRKSHDTLRNI